MTVVVAQNLIQIIPIILITATTRQNRGQDNKEAKISHRIEDRLGKVKFSRMNSGCGCGCHAATQNGDNFAVRQPRIECGQL
nr:hypothetical protein Itr_chr12CG15870 [Ipomoea trifida]GMD34008.1 hypothetical protein Iba_chr09cCG8010 [Ipomoea batatas]